MELCIPNSLAFFSGSCHSHRHCRLLRQGDATKQFLLRLCLSFLSVSHACLGVGANFEVRFNLDPFGKKSDEDLLGDNLCKFRGSSVARRFARHVATAGALGGL